jgi:hypothetical protein
LFHTKRRHYYLLLVAGVVLVPTLLTGCGPGGPSPEELEAVDYTPLAEDDWPVSTPAEQ